MGLSEAEQSHGGEVGIWPFLMIASVSFSLPMHAPAQDASQPSSDVAVHGFKRRGFALFEVLKPSFQRSIEILADPFHAASLVSPGLLPNRILEPLHALLARPFHAAFEVVAQEVKSPRPARFHDSRFLRMQ